MGAINRYIGVITELADLLYFAGEPKCEYGLDELQVKIENGDAEAVAYVGILCELSQRIEKGEVKIIETKGRDRKYEQKSGESGYAGESEGTELKRP